MKILICLSIIVNVLFAIPQCDQNQNLCAYQYSTPLTEKIIVINMRNKTVIFSVGGKIGNESKVVYNRKLKPYKRYTLIKKNYKYGEDHERVSYQFTGENYIAGKNQNLKLNYPY